MRFLNPTHVDAHPRPLSNAPRPPCAAKFKKNFTVVAPVCDFDTQYDREEMFSTISLPEFAEPSEFTPGH